jgi:tetratricopeptide (TPR) repeat protein
MAEASRQLPKFPWDVEVPDDAFWSTLDHNIGRNFFSTYSEAEISQLTFPENLTNEEKLRFLRDTFNNSLIQEEKAAAPLPLRDAEYYRWRTLMSALVHMDYELGDLDAAERGIKEQLEDNRPEHNGKINKGVLFSLMEIQKERGKYADAESTALEALDWIKGIELCGPNSPQALGCMRTLVISIWKQGRYSDAQEWIKKCETSIDEMAKTDFKKYVADEKRELAEQVKLLEQWKLERSAKI